MYVYVRTSFFLTHTTILLKRPDIFLYTDQRVCIHTLVSFKPTQLAPVTIIMGKISSKIQHSKQHSVLPLMFRGYTN